MASDAPDRHYRPGVRLRARDDDEWELVNDERDSGVEWQPLLFARDGRSAWIRSQFVDGPDGVLAFDAGTRKSTLVLRHPHVDPAQYILAADGRELVGAWFVDGAPEARFIDARAPAARPSGSAPQRSPAMAWCCCQRAST